MPKVCLRKRRFSERDRTFRRVMRQFIWALNPEYMITLNFNYSNNLKKQAKRKYRNERPRHDWMKDFDAALNSRLVHGKVSRLQSSLRVSWLPFAEFTTTDNLHYHMLLSLPARHRFSDAGLTRRKLHSTVRPIIREILEGFFR
jgi:hypothetical protein